MDHTLCQAIAYALGVADAQLELAGLADVLADASVADRGAVLGAAFDDVEIDGEHGIGRTFVNRSAFCPNGPFATRDHG